MHWLTTHSEQQRPPEQGRLFALHKRVVHNLAACRTQRQPLNTDLKLLLLLLLLLSVDCCSWLWQQRRLRRWEPGVGSLGSVDIQRWWEAGRGGGLCLTHELIHNIGAAGTPDAAANAAAWGH
jgi:hypothetical protein